MKDYTIFFKIAPDICSPQGILPKLKLFYTSAASDSSDTYGFIISILVSH